MKLLKIISLVILLLCVATVSAQWKKIKGNGNITTIDRATESYEGLKAAGPMDFILVPETEGNITIKGDANLMEYIVTEVKNNLLVIKIKNSVYIKPTKPIKVTIPYESIDKVSLAGSGDITNTGVLKSNSFKVSLAGSGDITLKISTHSIESEIAGSGNINLEGSARDLVTKIAGSGDFNGDNLQSNDVTAKITGSGSAKVVCNGNLKVRITGSGNVKYSGKPIHKDTKVTGSGSISN